MRFGERWRWPPLDVRGRGEALRWVSSLRRMVIRGNQICGLDAGKQLMWRL